MILMLFYDIINHMKQCDFPIIIEQGDNGYFATCPELQGCYSQGETYEEAVSNIKDAINLHLQDRISLSLSKCC